MRFMIIEELFSAAFRSCIIDFTLQTQWLLLLLPVNSRRPLGSFWMLFLEQDPACLELHREEHRLRPPEDLGEIRS